MKCKKLYLLAECVWLLSCLTACKTKQELTKLNPVENASNYVREIVKFDNIEHWICNLFPYGNSALAYTVDDTLSKHGDQDYMIDFTDWSATQVYYNSSDAEGLLLSTPVMDDAGNMVEMHLDYNEFDYDLTVRKSSADGNEILLQDVKDLVPPINYEEKGTAEIMNILLIEKDTLAVIMSYQIVLLYDDYTKADYIEMKEGTILSAASMTNGNVICAVEDDEKCYLQEYDVKHKRFGERVRFKDWKFEENDTTSTCELLDGVDYDFYCRKASGIYGFDWNEKTYRTVIDFKACGFDNQAETSLAVPIMHGAFVMILLPQDESEEDLPVCVRYRVKSDE